MIKFSEFQIHSRHHHETLCVHFNKAIVFVHWGVQGNPVMKVFLQSLQEFPF